jgi:predicted aldo/keto reductase-like oxidoreductase
MNISAQEKLVGKARPEQLIRYSLSLPVAACVIGMPKMEFLEENIALVKGFQPMPDQERGKLFGSLAPQKASIDGYFNGHLDA